MGRQNIDFDIVRAIALTLPGAEDGTVYGSPAIKIKGKLLAGIPANKSAEAGSLGVRIDFEQRAALLRDAPQTYYITDHYRNYPIVLVRLSRIDEGALRDLLDAAHRFVSAEAHRKSSARRNPSAGRKKKLKPL